MKANKYKVAFALYLATVFLSNAVYAAPTYRITPISYGMSTSYGHGINNSGEVTGSVRNSIGKYQAFIYSGSHINLLNFPDVVTSKGRDINNSGMITGSMEGAEGKTVAFVYDGLHMQSIGTLGGEYSEGFSINNSGVVVGRSKTSQGPTHPFKYDGSMIDLGTLGGGHGQALAINDAGQIVGTAQHFDGTSYMFLHDGSEMKGVAKIDLSVSYIDDRNDINSSGQALGISASREAFLYDQGSHLGFMPKGQLGRPNSINEAGAVVGKFGILYGSASPPDSAFYMDESGIYELVDLIDSEDPLYGKIVLKDAKDINDSGQITGHFSFIGSSYSYAYIATPMGNDSESDGIGGLEGEYALGFANSSIFLAMPDAAPREGLPLAASSLGTEAQWILNPINDKGDYQIKSAVAQQFCLGSSGWSGNVVFRNCSSSGLDNLNAQIWRVSEAGENYSLRNKGKDQCLTEKANYRGDVYLAFSECSGENLSQGIVFGGEDTGTTVPSDLGGERILSPRTPGTRNVGWSSNQAGASVELVSSDKSPSWYFSFAPHTDNYLIQSKSPGEARCLALPSWSNSLPILNRCDNGDRQKWDIEGSESEGYRLKNAETGECLSRIDASNDKLRVRECNGSNLQYFIID